MMLSAGNGFIMQSDKYSRYNAGQSLKKYILLKKGELAYNHGASKAKQFGCCYELLEDEALIPYVYHCFKVDKNEYTPYVAFLLNNPKIDRQLKRLVSSSARMDGLLNISFKDYMSINLSLPPYAEQKQVSDFIKRIDERIVIQEQLISSLKKYKRGSLSALFPKKGEITPQYRFAGFTKPWEQRKLRDFGKATGGTSIESEFSKDGVYKVINIGSYSESSVYNDQGIRAIKSDKTSNRVLNKNDLTMILNDKTASGNIIGRVLLIEKSGVYVYNQRTERIEINIDKYDSIFLYEMLNAPNIREKIIKQAQGNTQIYVNWTTIASLDYMIPSRGEQIKIGEYLHSLTNLITLHQHKYDILLSLKNALLQQLFI